MKRYIQKKILSRFSSLIKKLSRKANVIVDIQEMAMAGFTTIKLRELAVFSKNNEKLGEAENLSCKILIFKSLLKRSLVGRLDFRNARTENSPISEKLFQVNTLQIAFAIRPRKQAAIIISIEDIEVVIQARKRKQRLELLINVPHITWNRYLSLLGNNINFNHLKNLCSDDSLSAELLLCYDKLKQRIAFFDTKVSWDKLTLKEKVPVSSPVTISKEFLLEILKEKLYNGILNQHEYIAFNQTPMHFVNAVVCTEDPSYWAHKGIDTRFIGYAIETNIKNKRFERGASTITMQMVRNLFLNHDKNLLRKIEESVITLLLENYYKVDKKDIIETYINLIEFAPNVRGLYKACHFYFSKPYTKLTLTDSLVLTYIIPRPRHFYDALLVKTEQLQRNLYSHLTMYSNIMLKNRLINEIEFNNISYDIIFSPQFGELSLAKHIVESK